MIGDYRRPERKAKFRGRCPHCGLTVELILEFTGEGSHQWRYTVHALFSIRCEGSLTVFDLWSDEK